MSEANDRGEAASLSMGHNSNGVDQPDLPFRLSGSQAKTAKAIAINVERMIREAGIESVGFLTLTIGNETEDGFKQVFDADEASRRINSLLAGLLPELFSRSVIVSERHKSKAIHFHLVVEMANGADIRTGFNFAEFHRGGDSNANAALKAVWGILRARLPGYGFGRAQLTPIEKTGEAIACYVSKYVEKNLFNRLPEDKGKRLVRYSGWQKTHCRSHDIGWATPRAALWRKSASAIAAVAAIETPREAALYCGPKWAWAFTQIMGAPAFETEYLLRVAMQREIARRTPEAWERTLSISEKAKLEFEDFDAGAWLEAEGRAA